MRGAFKDQGGLFSYISSEARIPTSHPLRKIRELVREVLSELNPVAWAACTQAKDGCPCRKLGPLANEVESGDAAARW